MPELADGFRILGNEIVDARTGEPVSPADFNARSTPAEKDRIHRELVARGLMTNQQGEGGSDMLEEEDAQLGDAPDEPATARPVSQTDTPAPAKDLPEPKTARPSLQHFMEVMQPRFPDMPTRELHRYWAKRYSDIDPKALPTFETFLPAVKERNPGLSDKDARTYWEEHYGDFGAREKNPPSPGFLGTAKDMGLKAAAGVVDVAQSAVGLASLASGGKAGEILRDLGWNPEEATKFLNSKTSEAQQAADQAVHDAKGFVDTVIAYAKNPRAIAGGLSEAAPGIATMGLMARKAAVTIAEKAAAPFGGLATAEGAAAAEKAVEAAAGKLMWVSSGTEGALSAGQIADQAQGAGREYSDYLLPSVAGGAGTAVIGRGAGKVMGGSAEIPMFTGSHAGAMTGNWATRTAKSIFSEGFLEEMPQSAQEQVFQNLALGKPWNEGVPEAAAAGAVVGSAMGGAMGGVQRPTPPPQEEEVPEPQKQGPQLPQRQGPQLPQRIGPQQPQPFGPQRPQPEGPQLPQRIGPNLPESLGPQLEKALGPSNQPQGPYRPTVKDVLASSSLDDAIEATQGLINSFEVPNIGGPEKRPSIEPTLLDAPEPTAPPLIQPGSVFTPRQEPEPPTGRDAIAAERARILAQREERQATLNRAIETAKNAPPGTDWAALSNLGRTPAPTQPTTTQDTPLPSALDKAYPSVAQVKHLAESKGVSTSVLSAIVQQTTGAKSIDDLSPADLQQLSDKLESVKPYTPPKSTEPKPQESSDLFAKPAATAPLPVADAAKVPRHELAPEQNQALLDRAEQASHDLTMTQGDHQQSLRDFLGSKGGLQDQGGELSHLGVDSELKPFQKKLIRTDGLTLDEAAELAHEAGYIQGHDLNELLKAIEDEHRGRGANTADWYREATTGPNKLTRDRVDAAVAKIIEDHGRDVGKDVERVKAILLQDQQFTDSGHAPTTDQDWADLVEAATEKPSQPAPLSSGNMLAAPPSPEGPAATPTPGTAQNKYKDYWELEAERKKAEGIVDRPPELWERSKTAVLGDPGMTVAKHREAIEKAIKDGKEVSGLALMDYPDLKEMYRQFRAGQEKAKLEGMRKPKDGQQEIHVPPPTSGERPIIGREPTKEEAPLFSLAAQEPDAEQGGLSFDQKPEEEKPSSPPASAYVRAVSAVSDAVLAQLKGKGIITTEWLLKQADTAFGGTRAEGKYTEKDAYEALEMGVNKYILQVLPENVQDGAFGADAHLFKARAAYAEIHKSILQRLPAQRPARTEEQNEFQQFSTIPDLAYVMNYAAAIHRNDVMLEPSAGLGGLASFAKVAGATVYVNEYNARRADLLKTMGFDRVFTENAEQLNNVLPDDVKPTVIVMNPPFSSTAGRMEGQRDSRNVLRHLDQALARLQPGGRLVALIGMGRNGKDPQYLEEWIDNTAKKYAYRARVRLSGEGYKKYGTKYDNQFLVFDKMAPDGKAPVVTPTLATSFEALNLLGEVVNVRSRPTQSASTQSGSQAPAPGSQSRPDERPAVPAATDVVGSGAGQARPGPRGGAGASRPSGTRDTGTAGQPGQDSGTGVPTEGNGRPSGKPTTQPPHDADRPDAGGSGVSGPGQPSQSGERRPEPGAELPERVTLDAADEAHAPAPEKSDAIFETYRPKKVQIAGAHPHPGQLVESSAMSAVEPPAATYRPTLPKEVITEGRLSLPQLESTVYAGQAHQEFLPSGERQGFFDGDGTGVGKGREIAGIILDNVMQGRKKAVWLSKGENLFSSAVRDWQAVAGKDHGEVFSQGNIDLNGKIEQKDGVLFTYYSLIGSGLDLSPKGELETKKDEKGKQAPQTRFSQLRDWLGKDFDGVIVFDEAHEMRNNMTTEGARGDKKPAMKALAGVELQKLFPKARIAYFSATGGIEVSDFGYAERLGMWGPGTAFPTKQAFVGGIQAGGMATMEVVAQDLKANGLYVSRSLSYDDVTYERLTHELTPVQKEQYDALARGWQIIIRNIRAALEVTGADKNGRAKGAAYSALWGAQLRFFDQILVTMQMPSVLARMKKDLEAGHAVVVQLTKTNEAALKNELKAKKAEGASLDDLDLTPRQMMLGYLRASFPVQEYETFTDENGNVRARPVVDSEGRPVENKEAVAVRDQLIEDLGLLKFPDPAMEQILNTFGYQNVAEVTGRHVRVVQQEQEDGSPPKGIEQKRSKAVTQKEAQEFMDDKRSILIFSDAGGTGQSYHADNTAKNKRRRMHYVLQPGWRADAAMQGLGRTHRTNQASAPHYMLTSTDLNGHKRFISTIARRLAQLGALTKGQRQTTSQGLFSERDNLENAYASGSIKAFFVDLRRGDLGRFGWTDLLDKMGLDEGKLLDKNGNLIDTELPDVPKFLNRLLTLEYADQNDAFDLFMARMDRAIELAKANGTFQTGMENYRHDGATVTQEQTVHTDQRTKAVTKLVQFTAQHRINYLPYQYATKKDRFQGFYTGTKTGKMYATYAGYQTTKEDGEVVEQIKLQEPDVKKYRLVSLKTFRDNYVKVMGDAEKKWKEAIAASPAKETETVRLLAGALLRIWDRLPKTHTRVLRVVADDGRRVVGRLVPDNELNITLERLGVEGEKEDITVDKMLSTIEDGGTVEFANGWKIGERRVNQEDRLELWGPNLGPFKNELKQAGLFTESIRFETRFFIPLDQAKEILQKITQHRPVLRLNRKQRGGSLPQQTSSPTSDDEEGLSSAQVSQPAPTFYSHALKVLETKMPARANFEQIKGILNNNAVKPDEIKWIGLDDYLKTKDYFTKEDVLNFVRQNQVQVGEVMMGNKPNTEITEAFNEFYDMLTPLFGVQAGTIAEEVAEGTRPIRQILGEHADKQYVELPDSIFRAAEELRNLANGFGRRNATDTRFSGHLPIKGGTNYREIVMTLPAERIVYTHENVKSVGKHDDPGATTPELFWYFRTPDNLLQIPKSKYPTKESALAYVLREKQPAPVGKYTSSHWSGIANPIAHLRVADFTDAEGKKVLVVLENQSDWHQAGKKSGYIEGSFADHPMEATVNTSANEPYWEVRTDRGVFVANVVDLNPSTSTPDQAIAAARQLARTRGTHRGVPDAPFKKNWHELVMRRALRLAAEGGYDKIGWVTGQQTAYLYDLSKQIDRIDYLKNEDGTFQVSAIRGGEEVLGRDDQTKAQLIELVGKDAAEKMDRGEGTNRATDDDEPYKSLSGLGLKIGGAWATKLYDEMIPQYMSKLGKKWGATVGESALRVVDPQQARIDQDHQPMKAETIHALPITDAMRDSVMGGQALFQRKANLDPSEEEAQAVQAGIEGKSVLQAAQFVAAQAPTQVHREIAGRVVDQIKKLQQAGMQFELIVSHDGDMVPSSLINSRGLTGRSFGSNVAKIYIQGADVTGYVGMSYETVLHELVHAVTQTAVHVGSLVKNRGTEIHTLVGDLRSLHDRIIDHFNARVKSGAELTEFERRGYNQMHNALKNPDELLAWGLTNPEMQTYLESIPYQASTLWNSFVDAIRRFLGLSPKADTALSEVLRVADSLLEFPIGEYAMMAAQANLPMTVNQHDGLSSQQQESGIGNEQQNDTGMIDPLQAKDRLKAATTKARPYLLGSLGLHQLATVYGKDHREVANYNRASQQMETDFVEITRESDEILKHWDKLKVNVADRMARVMEQARFANYDPDPQVNRSAPDDPKEQALRDAFNNLPDDAKAVYREARDFYAKLADRRFEAIAGRIERSGGTPENRRAALDKLKLAYDQVRAKVYFPFTRFGEHIVIAKQMVDGVEKDREVSAFESPLEAQQFATLMKARGWKVKQTLAKEYSRDQEGAASKAVREILNVVQGIDESNPRMMDQLLDAINQTFINALPDMSYAKHFTHAKDVKGFSKDALRAFAHSALHGAHHISRIQNADHLTRALATMDERINREDEGDVTEARQVHNELTLRHNDLLNPNVSPVTAWLGQLGFTMSLGGVIATGVTNATQVPLVTLPWLGARYGFGKAGAHLARAYKDFLDPATLNADSLFDASQSKRITEPEREMLKELQRRGRIDLTQTMDLSGRASQDNLSRVARQHGSIQDKIAKMLGFTFHAPEVMNRQVTALATYRMEMTRSEPNETAGQKQARAIAQAEAAIIDTHFIYTQENRPRYMSGNVMRVLTMFKQYGQNIAFLYGRAAQLWLTKNQATAEEKAIAKKQLLSMAGLQFAAAGALGMPFVGTVASLFTALLNGFGDDDDKKDWEVELRKYLAEAVGKDAGEVLSHGVSRLTPWDMSARLGQADLFFRAPQREREGRAAAMDWITSLSGPVLGYAVNAYLGVGDVAKGIRSADSGHFLRGVEEMTPALIRNQVKALRFELEGGIQSRDHHQQLDVTGAEKLGQFFGFAPSRGAEMYEGMTAIKNHERHLAGRRADLLDAYAAAYESGDQAKRQDVIEEVRAFNSKHRELAINGDTLLKSLRGRKKREQGMQGGVYLPAKRQGLRQEGNFANY